MSKQILSTADGTLDWEDARDGDFVRVNAKRHKVVVGAVSGVPSAFGRGLHVWEACGGILERDVPVHPLDEAEVGTVIRVAGGAVYEFDGVYWLETGYAAANDTHDLFRNVGDDYEVLWPRPEPPKIEAGQVWRHEDGRYFRPVMEVSRLSPGAWRGTCGGPNWSSGGTATAEGLIAAGFRLDTEEEEA